MISQIAPLPGVEISPARWMQEIEQSALRNLLALALRPDVLSFALGMPASDLFPTSAYSRAAAEVLATDSRALQYGLPLQALKAHIVSLMALRGVECSREQVFLTTGAQQGMDLIARLLLDQGGQVLVEETTYDGLLMAIKPLQPEVLTVPSDLQTGIDTDAVESLLAGGVRPAFIYAMADGHNPLGVSMSMSKRIRLVELARRYAVPIVEDDAYGFLYYEKSCLPPLRALDHQTVLYVGSFSKILAPALRSGWLIVPETLTAKLSVIKHGSDLDVSSFVQRTISAYLDAENMPGHLAMLRAEYRARRDAMLGALKQHFRSDVHWSKPTSGMFIWVELPETIDAARLLQLAVDTERVAFIPGQAFYAGGAKFATNCIRLNFSNCSVEMIEDGIARLARVINFIGY